MGRRADRGNAGHGLTLGKHMTDGKGMTPGKHTTRGRDMTRGKGLTRGEQAAPRRVRARPKRRDRMPT